MAKFRPRLWLGIGAAIALSIYFASIFISYAQPMEERVYNLSLLEESSEVETFDRTDAQGWSIYTREGDTVTPLVHDGFGGFDHLDYAGQTFYFSRVLVEKLDAPTIQLGAANRNFSVFLDGELIYTDCPEQDNTIGHLTLPMREWDRKEDVIISLPEDYVGKTLTIAQSTPTYGETPRSATKAIPTSVKLYCSYAYESALIAESFRTAFVGAADYAVGMLLLIFFVRRLFQNRFEWSMLLLALTVFFCMTAHMYTASYSLKYFGIPRLISTSSLCQYAAVGALLAFLSARATRLRSLAWSLTGAYAAGVLLFLLGGNIFPASGTLSFLLWRLQDMLGVFCLLGMMIVGWFCRSDRSFFRYFAPLSAAAIIAALAVRLILPDRGEFFAALLNQIRTMTLQHAAYETAVLWMIVSIGVIAVQTVCSEFDAYTEKRLVVEMGRMSQQRYENLRRYNDEVMMLRHDMKRHFTYLRQTTADEKTAAYLDELLGQNEKIRPVVQSGNEILDVILASRYGMARDAGIRVEIIRAGAPPRLPIPDSDLCSVIMNLMDNAVEGARASGAKEPFIRLDMHIKNDFFVFVCENSAQMRSLNAANEEAVPKHGLGLRIVRQIVERCGSLMQTEFGQDYYKVRLALPLPQDSR